MRARGWLWAAALAGLAVLCVLRFHRGRALETDLLAMLPATEQNPVAEQAVEALARTTQDRAIFLVKGPDDAAGEAAAQDLAKGLETSGAFHDVQCALPPIDPGALVRFYAPHRFQVAPPGLPPGLAPLDLGGLIQAHLSAPGFTGVAPELDPLGGFGAFLARLPFQASGLELRDGLLVAPAPDGLHVLVAATLKGSAFDPEEQARVLGAEASARRGVAARFPSAEILRTGVVFYAADARMSAEREMNRISLLTALAIFGLYLLVFRSLRHLLLGLACVAAGLVLAVASCLLVFGRLHLLTLVCGASVLGVSVDYSFLYFAHHLGAGPGWEPRAGLRRLMPALLLGLGTTLLGYAALLAAPFPGLRQIAVFSVVGLAGAFLTVLWVLPDFLASSMAPRPVLMGRLERLRARARGWAGRRGALAATAALVLVLTAGIRLGRVDDDVHGLIVPSRALQRDEARIQGLMKISTAGAFFLVEGADEGQVLAREEALRARVDGLVAISGFVPSPSRQEADLARNREAAPLLRRGMAEAGFRPEAVDRALADLSAPPLTVAGFLRQDFAIPLRPLWLGATSRGQAAIALPVGAPERAALLRASAGLEGVTLVDKAQSVSALLAHYRTMAAWALCGAVLLVGLLLGAWYGLRPGLRLLAPAVLGMLAALALGALLGVPVTLFTIMALILALGFGVDYTVFLKEGGAPALLGVALASYATLVSYGLLALSHTPALRGFGLTLALAVLVSTLTSFLALGGRE